MSIYTLSISCPLVYIKRVEDRGADAKSSQPHHHGAAPAALLSSLSKPQSGAEQRDNGTTVSYQSSKCPTPLDKACPLGYIRFIGWGRDNLQSIAEARADRVQPDEQQGEQ